MTTSSALSRRAVRTHARSRTRAVLGVLALMLAVALPQHVATPSAGAAVAEVGYRDFSYGAGTTAPTADKPQSKLWFTAGQWWGSLFSPVAKAFTIHRLDGATQEWSDTGVVIDSRADAKVDALWDGGKLYVAAGGPSSTDRADDIQVTRYSFTAGQFVRDASPYTVVTGGSESVVLDRDSTGVLWLTYTRGGKVYVTHSDTTATGWIAPYVLPVEGASDVSADDISALVSFGGQIGVLWGNQNASSKSGNSYWFAVHRDGTGDSAASWTRELAYGGVPGTENADDHMNIKSLQTDDQGRIFASVKTSLNAADDPLVVLLVREPTGTWDRDNVFGKAAENHTRAIVLLDATNDTAHVFAASPCCSGGVIYHKKVSFAALRNGNPFANGLGAPFIRSSLDTTINNPTSTKQTLDGTTGLVVLASDDTSRWYLHNKLDLAEASTVVPDTSITSGPTGNVGSTSASFAFSSENTAATFECRLDDAPAFTSCLSPQAYSGLAVGAHRFAVRAVTTAGPDPSPAERSWTIDASLPATFRPAADAVVKSASPSTNYGTTLQLVSDTSPLEESHLRFSIRDIGTRKVTGAKLRLYVTNGSTNGPALYLTQNPTWTETGITWGNKPSRAATALGNKSAVASNAWTEYDLSSTVTADGEYGFALVADSSDGTDVHSREAVNRPEIVVTFAADTTAPETRIDSAPSGTVETGTAELAFASNEPSRFECSLDRAPYRDCTSPVHYDGLSNGDHVFAVRAIDSAGNVDETPATASWTVARLDQTAPETTITQAPSGTVESADAVIEFLSDEPATFQCRLDDATFDECESPVHHLDLSDGPHTFEVRAVDAAGNVDQAPATASWTVARPDTTAPETTITSAPSGTVHSAEATLEFSSNELGTLQCRLDGSTFDTCTSPVRHVGLSDGEHVFEVRAVDAAGNVDTTPATARWTVAASTLLADGFEDGLAAWSVTTKGDGAAAVQGLVVREGASAARLSASSAVGSASTLRKTFTTGQQTLTAAADVRVAEEGVTGANVPLLRLFDDSGARVLSLYRQNLAKDKVYVSYGGSASLTRALLPLNTWARVEVQVTLQGPGVSAVEVKVDGVVVHSSTVATVASAIRAVQLGNETARQTFVLYADDVRVTSP